MNSNSAGRLTIIDARSKRAFMKSHLSGAIHIDPYLTWLPLYLRNLSKKQIIVIYCRTFKRSGELCRFFTENGFSQVIQIADGFTGWKQNNLPLKSL